MVARLRIALVAVVLLGLAAVSVARLTTEHVHLSAKAHDCALCYSIQAASPPAASIALPVPHEAVHAQPVAPARIHAAEPILDTAPPRAPPV